SAPNAARAQRSARPVPPSRAGTTGIGTVYARTTRSRSPPGHRRHPRMRVVTTLADGETMGLILGNTRRGSQLPLLGFTGYSGFGLPAYFLRLSRSPSHNAPWGRFATPRGTFMPRLICLAL